MLSCIYVNQGPNLMLAHDPQNYQDRLGHGAWACLNDKQAWAPSLLGRQTSVFQYAQISVYVQNSNSIVNPNSNRIHPFSNNVDTTHNTLSSIGALHLCLNISMSHIPLQYLLHNILLVQPKLHQSLSNEGPTKAFIRLFKVHIH